MTYSEIALRRSNCFKLLAACFYEPDKTLLQEEKVTENLRDLFCALDPEISARLKQLAEALANYSEKQLKVDYASLFVGPFELLAVPYGSVYLEKGGRVLGESTLAVQKWYEDAGLSLDVQEPADHIAIELEFLFYLSAREAEAWGSGRDADARGFRTLQEQFITDFMGWVPDFCKRIEKGAQTEFYQLLAQYFASFFQYCQKEFFSEPSLS